MSSIRRWRSDAGAGERARHAKGAAALNADSATHQAVILDEGVAEDRRVLDGLRADPCVEFLDRRREQVAQARALRPAPGPELAGEPTRWAYYPWRRTVVGILGPSGFRAVRLDRNRHLITLGEQARLASLCVGVAGLSVGHVVAHTLAAQGLCGALKVADFDTLELSNLNRVPATVLDLGINKATLAARRIAELDPYLRVEVMPAGLTAETIGSFLDGLDVVVEECDSLDMKVAVREEARRRRLPVLMATSDRGLLDVERFDLEPDRPVLHGLLGAAEAATLADMAVRDKIPYMLAHLDAPRLSARVAASMLEVGHTLTTWPQLAGDVVLGAAAVAEAVRRIGLGEDLSSGRVRIDVAGTLSSLGNPVTEPGPAPSGQKARPHAGAKVRNVSAAEEEGRRNGVVGK
jgi:molybdopterin/thiamine biosynthesis adenylyltransferase